MPTVSNTWSKPPKPKWTSTIAFRHFRTKHGNLSRIYWTWQLGIDAVKKVASLKKGTDFIVDAIGPHFKRGMLPDTCDEFAAREDDRTGVFRLYLLVMCSANLEAYLQDVIRLHVGAQGHAIGPMKLTKVGDAIAKPVIRSSTIPDMLDYIESLVGVDFGKHRENWQKAYRLRCAAAHNGGFVDGQIKKKIPDIGFDEGQSIKLDWDQLITYLSSADEIAAFVDSKVSTKELRELELEWRLHEIKSQGKLPSRKDLWAFVHAAFGESVPSKAKARIELNLYQK
jgi:hypothetical protein